MLKFKSMRQQKEFICDGVDKKLKKIITMLEMFMDIKFQKGIEITEVLRTQPEQDKIYFKNLDYKNLPWKSVHQFGRGIDISIREYNDQTIAEILEILNKIPYDKKNSHQTALRHDVGYGDHIHIQVSA